MFACDPLGNSLKDVPKRSAQMAASSLPSAPSESLTISFGTPKIFNHIRFKPPKISDGSLLRITSAKEKRVHSSQACSMI